MKKIKKQSKIKILGGTCGTEKKRQSNESRQKKKTSKVKRRSLSADERDDDNFSPSKPFNGKNQFFPSRGSPLPSLSPPFSPFSSLLSHSLSTGLNYAGFFPHVVLGCLRFKSNLFPKIPSARCPVHSQRKFLNFDRFQSRSAERKRNFLRFSMSGTNPKKVEFGQGRFKLWQEAESRRRCF